MTVRVFGNTVAAFVAVAVLVSIGVASGGLFGGVTAAVRIEAVLAVLALGAAARLSIASGGFATADFIMRSYAQMAAAERDQRMDEARGRLGGAVLALGVTAAGGGLWLAVSGSAFDPLIAVLVGACLLIRSCLFTGAASVFAVAAGAVVLAVGVVNLAVQSSLVPGQLWVVIGLAAVCAAILISTRPRKVRASGHGLLMWAESTSVIALVCVLVAAVAPWAALVGAPA